MSTKNPSQQEVIISLSDFYLLCKRAKRKIVYAALLMAVLAVLYTLSKPVGYLATGSFREKSKSQSGLPNGSGLSILLSGGQSANNSEAMSSMLSRTLLENVAKQLNLQANLRKNHFQFKTLANIYKNLNVEYQLYNKKIGPIFPDQELDIAVKDVLYNGEAPGRVKLRFLTEDTYQVYPVPEGVNETGTIGQPFVMPYGTFTIVRNNQHPLSREDFLLDFIPFEKVVENLSRHLGIETDRDDKSILKLKYLDENRQLAAIILNSVMTQYQKLLRKDQQSILDEQLNYLQARQDLMQKKLKGMMDDHAEKLSIDLTQTGFPNTDQAMHFFATAQEGYIRELLAIDLELKRLQQVETDGSTYYERYVSEGGPTVINQIVSQIRQLKHQGDSMELALREAAMQSTDILKDQEKVALQFIELTRVRTLSQEVMTAIASLDKGEIPDSSLRLYHDSHFMVKNWCDRLIANHDNKEEYKACSANFTAYLSNLLHHFNVHEKALQERLTHQQSTPIEFQGINLDVAKELYVVYSKQLNEIEAKIQENDFVIAQMKTPEFEVSSLTTILNDKVSDDIITRAGKIVFQLKDLDNRSLKEQDRLKHELELQKGFLEIHLKQTIQLLQQREKLLKEKIRSLQNTILGLIQAEISVLQENLSEQVKNRISNRLQEQSVIEEHQHELQLEMAKLPNKWVSEQMIAQQTEVNTKIVEEITRLVESKNITTNLELIQSAPVDLAKVPSQPRSPRILIFAILGAALGALMMISWVIVQSLLKGMIVTDANLRLGKQNVSGTLSNICGNESFEKPLLDSDLETLRRLGTYLNSLPNKKLIGNSVLFITGIGPDYSMQLSKLMSITGVKILILPISFDGIASTDSLPGLLQYLEGEAAEPKINTGKSYDYVVAGGISRFNTELLSAPAFQAILDKLQTQYDWIFVLSHALPNSSEAEYAMQRFDSAVISISGDTWTDIRGCVQIANDEQKNLSFVLIDV
jgi:tyrosine-protein kinase Etk/Wzc